MFPVDFAFKNKESNTCLVNVQYIMIMHFFLLRFFQVLKPIYQKKLALFAKNVG